MSKHPQIEILAYNTSILAKIKSEIVLHIIKQIMQAVSYTHLTLPTNREV